MAVAGCVEYLIEAGLAGEPQLDLTMERIYGRELAGLLMLLGGILRALGPSAGTISARAPDLSGRWMSDPFAFGQAQRAVALILDIIRPEGDPIPAHLRTPLMVGNVDLNETRRDIGRRMALPYIEAIADPESAPSAEIRRIATEAREKLGTEIVSVIKQSLAESEAPAEPPAAEPSEEA